MILVIDNYDSFVHNLARYAGMLGYEREVVRNDEITVEEIAANPPEAIILSPGPYGPERAGISMDIIKYFAGRIPIIGVCLGHQCIVESFGGSVQATGKPVHGKASSIYHDGTDLFMGLPSPMQGARYHSLETFLGESSPLEIVARTEEGTVMAVQHKTMPIYGLQFHPESIITEYGMDILRNFFAMAGQAIQPQKKVA